MGKGSKGSAKRTKPKQPNGIAAAAAALLNADMEPTAAPAPALQQQQDLQDALMAEPEDEESDLTAAQMESNFMAALQRHMGDVEMSEENVRKAIEDMSPEQRQQLAREGRGLKREVLSNPEHAGERKIFHKEIDKRAEAAGARAVTYM